MRAWQADPVVEAIRAGFRGELVCPDDSDYDDARRVWNGMVDRRPRLIARCADRDDVVRAVNVAREHGLVVAVRGGGHSMAGHSTCDDGIVIDLSRMSAVRVSPSRRRARVEGGCLLGALDTATQAHMLATPAGVVSHTGVAGLTLGGGFGWLSRKHGLAIDNLVSAQVVTADGTVRVAAAPDADAGAAAAPNADAQLFWAIRGGGGNFGVVTEFEFRLHRVGPVCFASAYYPLEDAAKMLRVWRDTMGSAPDELTWVCYLRLAPPLPEIPPWLRGKPVLCAMSCWIGDVHEGRQQVEATLSHVAPHGVTTATLPYRALQAYAFPGAVVPDRAYTKSGFLAELPDQALDAALAQAERLTSPMSQLELLYLGGAVSRVADDATAFTNRGNPFVLNLAGAWMDARYDGREVDWVRRGFAALRPHLTGGAYVNFMSETEGGRTVDAYGPHAYARLRALKSVYDPDNLFRLNQNIPPLDGR